MTESRIRLRRLISKQFLGVNELNDVNDKLIQDQPKDLIMQENKR